MTRVDVRDLIGIPYKVHGRDIYGMDCYGIIIEFMRRAGIEFPDVFYEHTDTASDEVRKAVMEGLPVEKIDVPEYGCLVDIQMHEGTHVGVYLGGGAFIHATRDRGTCVQKLRRYEKAVKGFWRIKDGSHN